MVRGPQRRWKQGAINELGEPFLTTAQALPHGVAFDRHGNP